MPWGPAPITSLTIPDDAGDNDPAIIIGSDVPAELTTFYTGLGGTIPAVIIFREDSANYVYRGLWIDPIGQPEEVVGAVTAGVVFHIGNYAFSSFYGVGVQFVGDSVNQTDLHITPGSRLIIDDGADPLIVNSNRIETSTGNLEIETTEAGSDLILEAADDISVIANGGSVGMTGALNVSDSVTVGTTFAASGKGSTNGRSKTSDGTINNSTTYTDDGHISGSSSPPVQANRTYAFLLMGSFLSSAVADIKMRFTGPAGFSAGGTGRSRIGGTIADQDFAAGVVMQGDGAVCDFQFSGWIVVGGTAGVITFQWAQNTAEVSNTSMRDGTMLVVFGS